VLSAAEDDVDAVEDVVEVSVLFITGLCPFTRTILHSTSERQREMRTEDVNDPARQKERNRCRVQTDEVKRELNKTCVVSVLQVQLLV
jgi:hypothetical protein